MMSVNSVLGGMELVSPICKFEDYPTWSAELGNIWWVLDNKFNTTTSQQCSTHIHVSPTNGAWTLSQARRVAKAVIYFERSIDSLLPEHRRTNRWCQSNRWNAVCKQQTISTLFGWVDQTSTMQHLVYYLCGTSKDSAYGQALGKTHDFPHNVYRWNFAPLKETGTGTIEFRQPPGSSSTQESITWIRFVAAFLQGANLYAEALDPNTPENLESLRGLLLNGAKECGMSRWEDLDALFTGKTQLPPGEYDLKAVTAEDILAMRLKAQEQNITLEKFKLLYGYK